MDKIAGICNEARNVLGMMPRPERVTGIVLGGKDESHVFISMMESVKR